MTIPFFAVIPDAILAALIQAGLLGPVVVFFMRWVTRERELQTERDSNLANVLKDKDDKLAHSLSERESKLDRRHDEMLEAINHLIRITGIEVMSRPKQSERAKHDAEEIMRAVSKRKG